VHPFFTLRHGALATALLVAGSACAGEDDGAVDSLGRTQAPIINGTPDSDHQAVVTVVSFSSACTGTIIHVEGAYAYVLTAAHCFLPGPPQQIRVGDDYNLPSQILSVVDFTDHPSYNQGDQAYDFGMVRASGANGVTPVIPALTPAEDTLAPGTQVLHVGYGLTSWPGGMTTRRHQVLGVLDQVAPAQISYNQPGSGPCSGDSGGPNLTVGSERVAGVISYGDEQCAVFGVSGRVSAVYDGFIVPYIEQFEGSVLPGSSSASSSSGGSTSSSGVGGSSSGSSGAGAGAPSGDDGWVAGGLQDRHYDGEVLTSGCSMVRGEPGRRPGSGWLLLVGAALALACGRRRPAIVNPARRR
jgi:hypothetical protein